MIIPNQGTIYPPKAVIKLFCELKKTLIFWEGVDLRVHDPPPRGGKVYLGGPQGKKRKYKRRYIALYRISQGSHITGVDKNFF